MKLAAILAFTLLLLSFAVCAHGQQIVFLTQAACAPCVTAHRIADPLVKELHINVVDCWSELGKEACRKYNVPATPTFIAINDKGEVMGRVDGIATEAQLRLLWDRAKPAKVVEAEKKDEVSPVCRLSCSITGEPGATQSGTGTLIYDDGKIGIVLTCAHVLEGEPPFKANFPGLGMYRGKVLAIDHDHELAALEIPSTGLRPLKINPDILPRNLTAGGYGPDSKWRSYAGTLTSVRPDNPAWREITGSARQGDSGGPVWDEKMCVVGVLWGTGDGHTTFACGQPLRRFLDRILPNRPGTVIPRASGGSAGGVPRQPSPAQPPTSEPPTNEPPVSQIPTPAEPTVDWDAWGKQLEQIAQNTGAAQGEMRSLLVAINNNKCNCDNTQILAVLNQQTAILNHIAGQVGQPIPTDKGEQHIVVVTDRSQPWWPHLSAEIERAKQTYHGIAVAPLPAFPIGVIPQAVVYENSVPIRVAKGEHDVIELLTQVARGKAL